MIIYSRNLAHIVLLLICFSLRAMEHDQDKNHKYEATFKDKKLAQKITGAENLLWSGDKLPSPALKELFWKTALIACSRNDLATMTALQNSEGFFNVSIHDVQAAHENTNKALEELLRGAVDENCTRVSCRYTLTKQNISLTGDLTNVPLFSTSKKPDDTDMQHIGEELVELPGFATLLLFRHIIAISLIYNKVFDK
jgi:hypothetical protein